MPSINRVPAGLLSLVDGKSLGSNPRDLSEIIQGGIDVRDLLLSNARRLIDVGSVDVVAGVGEFSIITIPAGELWIVHRVETFITGNAADNPRCVPALRLSSSSATIRLQDSLQTVGISQGGANRAYGATFNPPIVLNGGDKFSSQCLDWAVLTGSTIQTLVWHETLQN